jgi:hypothetical protein
MGEHYDVQVTLGDGVFPLTALAEGKNATALALVRTGARGAAAPRRPVGRAQWGARVVRRPARGAVSTAVGPASPT